MNNTSFALSPNSDPTTTSLPFYYITDTDSRGLIVTVTGILTSFVLSCLFIRVYIRLSARNSWKVDDSILTAATVLSCAQSGVVFSLAQAGFGTADDVATENVEHFVKLAYAVDFLYIFSLTVSKCAIACLFFRLTPNAAHLILVRGTIAASILWGVVSILLISISCGVDGSGPNYPPQCNNLLIRWQVITALDIATEIAIFANALYLVIGLQMSLKLRAVVVFAFGLRLPVIAFCAGRLSFKMAEISSPTGTLQAAYTIVWTQLELDYSIMSSTISCLAPFMQPFTKTYGTGSNSKYSAGRSAQGIPLEDITPQPDSSNGQLPFRKDLIFNSTSILHNGKSDQLSIGSTGSQQMIITKKTEWTIESHDTGAGNSPARE